ncbi:MAG: hypothetical protein HY557_04835, partial [Euryarchaeota archaeon]|nr:hypothetical protein [Euryarchaeota archaeon]
AVFYALYALGVVTALMTAFYAFRMWFMTFTGTYRGHDEEHLHESPRVMTVPLMILAPFTLVSGFFIFLVPGAWTNLIFYAHAAAESPLKAFTQFPGLGLTSLSIALASAGLALAYAVYYRQTFPAERFTRSPAGATAHRVLSNRYYMDRAYDNFAAYGIAGIAAGLDWFDRRVIDGAVNGIARGTVALARMSDWFDRKVVDGLVNALSLSTVRSSLTLRHRQTGQVQNYAAVVVLGLSIVILVVFVLRVVLPALGR